MGIGFLLPKNNGILNIVFICAWQKKQIFLRDIQNAEGTKELMPEQPTAGSLGMPTPHSTP